MNKFRAYYKELIWQVVKIDWFNDIIVLADDYGYMTEDILLKEVILMKSTGLYDIGKGEVFEGDIVYDDHNEEYGVVEFDEAKFVISWQSQYVEDLFERIDILSVISNIHKEPELVTSTFNPELRLK